MPIDFLSKPTPIMCPKCGHNGQKSIAWIKANPQFPCEVCGSVFLVDSANIDETVATLKKAADEVSGMQRKVRETFNRRAKR